MILNCRGCVQFFAADDDFTGVIPISIEPAPV